MSYTKLKDDRSTYSLDSLRLKERNSLDVAPPKQIIELFMKNGILYQTNDTGVEQQVGIPITTTGQRGAFEVRGAIIYNTTVSKHQGYDGTTWNNLY